MARPSAKNKLFPPLHIVSYRGVDEMGTPARSNLNIPQLGNAIEEQPPPYESVARSNLDPQVGRNREHGEEGNRKRWFWTFAVVDLVWALIFAIDFIEPEDCERSPLLYYLMILALIFQISSSLIFIGGLSGTNEAALIFSIETWLLTAYFLLVDNHIVFFGNLAQFIFSPPMQEKDHAHLVAQIFAKLIDTITRLVAMMILNNFLTDMLSNTEQIEMGEIIRPAPRNGYQADAEDGF